MKTAKRKMSEERIQSVSGQRSASQALIVVALLMLFAFALRVFRLDAVSLRGDEAFTVIFVQRTWAGLWKGISTVEPNPPLLYLALRVWVAIAGASEFATRYFAAFFGVLCVPLLYRLARDMFHSFALAFIAAALIAINPYQIWHSQDVRNYTLWPCLSLLALIFFWRWWNAERRTPQASRWYSDARILNLTFYLFATLASLYTHYYDVFVLAALNLFVFSFVLWERRWRTLARWIMAQVTLVVLYAPWVLFGTNRVTTYGEASAQQSVPLLDQFSRTLATLIVGDTVPNDLKMFVWVPLAFLLFGTLVYLARRDKIRAAFLALWIGVPTLALYAISLGRPLFLERYLNVIAPADYLAFALALNAIRNGQFKIHRWVFAGVGLSFVLLSTVSLSNYYFDPAYAKAPDWRALAQYIAERQQPGDVIVQNFTEMSAIYYRSGNIPVTTVPKDFTPTPADEKILRQLNQQYRRIWFIPAQPDWWDPDHMVENFLTRNDDRILETHLSVFRPQLYLTPLEFESTIIPVNVRVGDATLIGYHVQNVRPLHVLLIWQARQHSAQDLTVFVHLTDANDHIIAQQDSAPALGTLATSVWQPGERIVDAHEISVATPGVYTLVVGMYDPATRARVPVLDASGKRLADDRVVLTQVTIP